MDKNPYLEQENYFEGYQQKIEELKHQPEAIEFDKLCYLVFNNDNGEKLMNVFIERFLMPGFIFPQSNNAQYSALYYEGFKEAFRLIRNSIKAHKQRIEAEAKKK